MRGRADPRWECDVPRFVATTFLLLAGAAETLAQDGATDGPPPAARQEDEPAVPTMDAVRKAFEARNAGEAADGARRLLRSRLELTRDEVQELLLIECECCVAVLRNEDAVVAADRGLGLLDPRGSRAEELTWRFSRSKARALVHLGRFGEAERVLACLADQYPDSASDAHVVGTRALIRAARGPFVLRYYRGRFEGDPRIPAAVSILEASLPLAFERVRRRMGDSTLPFPPVLVLLRDEDSVQSRMDARAIDLGGWWVGVIGVRAAVVVCDPGEETGALAHELTHVLRCCGPRRPALPEWAEEGLARWMEEEEERPMWERLLFRAAQGSRLSSISDLVDLSDPSRSWESRPSEEPRILGELLFRYLERTRGRESVRAYASSLFHASEDPLVAFRRSFGGEPAGLQSELHREIRGWMHSAMEGLDDALKLREIQAAGDLDALDRACFGFLAEHPGSVLRPFIQAVMVQRSLESRDHARAAILVEGLRRDLPTSLAWSGVLLGCEFRLALALDAHSDVIRLGTETLARGCDIPDDKRREIREAVDRAWLRIRGDGVPAAPGPDSAGDAPR